MHIVVYRQQRPWSDPWEAAFAKGLDAHGVDHEVRSVGDPIECDVAVFWGHRRKDLMRMARATYLCMERGFFGDRESFTSLGWGGLNGLAFWSTRQRDALPDRWERHGPGLQPWRGDLKGQWLIMGQVPGDASIEGFDINAWCELVRQRLADIGIKAEIRRHPLSGGRGQPPIAEALAGAAAAFTYNSNAGVDAMIAGVPTVAAHPGSMVWDLAERWIDDSMAPFAEPWFRETWAHELAYKQWALEEIESGEAWEFVRPQCWCGNLCNDPDDFGPDPYSSEINGDDFPVWECGSCRVQSCNDI